MISSRHARPTFFAVYALVLSYPIFVIFKVAAAYELFEWIYAVMPERTAKIAVLRSEGDVWDAQRVS